MISRDISSGLRRIRQAPRSSAAIVVCIALGIAAVSAVTTLIYAVLYRPLPFPDSDQLVRLWLTEPPGGEDEVFLSYSEFRDIRDTSQTLSEVAAIGRSRLALVLDDGVVRMRGEAVSPEYFPMLGIRPESGRLFASDEYEAGAERTMVLSYETWSTHFGRDQSVVGSTVRTADDVFTILGVMPPFFRGTTEEDAVEFWVPLLHYLDAEAREERAARQVMALARLRSDDAYSAAAAEMTALGQGFAAQHPTANDNLRLVIERVGAKWRDEFRDNGVLLAAAIALLLLVAASNVAGLMLSRTITRRRQLIIHAAIGATPAQILRSLLIETALLAAIGGTLGILAAPLLLRTLLANAPLELPDYLILQPDTKVLLMSLGAIALTALAAGILPALTGVRTSITLGLNQSGGKATASAWEKNLGTGLVIAEVALTMTLLVASGMLLRSHQARNNVDLGYRGDVQRFAVTLSAADIADDEDLPAFYDRLQDTLRAHPGIQRAGLAWPVLPPRDWSQWPVRWAGMPADQQDRGLRVGGHAANADFFATLDIPLIAGRMFQSTDLPDKSLVCIASRSLAETLGGVEQALGKELNVGPGNYRVVGVVEDVLYGGAPEPGQRPYDLYVAHTQVFRRLVSVVARTQGDPAATLDEVRRKIQSLAPSSPVHWVSTMEEELAAIYADSRFYVTLISAFSLSALLLTTAGLFAMLSTYVARRSREFGIRKAMGADSTAITRGIVIRGLAMVLSGLALGLVGTFLVRNVLSSLLYGVAPIDVMSFLIGSAILLTVSLLACYLPARHANQVDPAITLRQE